MTLQSIISVMVLAIVLCIFLIVFIFVILSLIKWQRTAVLYTPPPVKLEEYSCPKCGSKELELIGRRTIRCKKCGTTFTIGMEVAGERFIIWPFFWWLPIIWPIPVREN